MPREKQESLPRPRQPSVKAERDALLWQFMQCTRAEVEIDHSPPLSLRERDPETGIYTPDANDPRFLVFMPTAEHRRKTNGPAHDSSQGDIHKAAKAKRLREATEEQNAVRSAILRPDPPEARERQKPKYRWPKRAFPKRRMKT